MFGNWGAMSSAGSVGDITSDRSTPHTDGFLPSARHSGGLSWPTAQGLSRTAITFCPRSRNSVKMSR